MSSANELNAVTRERATLREQVVTLDSINHEGDVYIRRHDVLALLNGVQPASTKSVPAAYAVERGQKVLPE